MLPPSDFKVTLLRNKRARRIFVVETENSFTNHGNAILSKQHHRWWQSFSLYSLSQWKRMPEALRAARIVQKINLLPDAPLIVKKGLVEPWYEKMPVKNPVVAQEIDIDYSSAKSGKQLADHHKVLKAQRARMSVGFYGDITKNEFLKR